MRGKRVRRRRRKSKLIGVLLSNGVAAFAAVMLLLILRPVKAEEIASMFIPPASTPHDELLLGQIIVSESAPPATEAPENALPVMSITIDQNKTSEGAGNVRVNNNTKFKPAYKELLSKKNHLAAKKKGVQVLILHSHGSEGYTSNNASFYLPGEAPRSTDLTRNVVSVGTALASALEAGGVNTLHLTDLCDVPSFNSAYSNSLKLAEAAIKENPSIRVIIDLHRDSIITSNGVKYRPITEIDGKNAAQIMFVVGTNEKGKEHKNWSNNLGFAMNLQGRLNSKFPGLMRPINLRGDRFNQHLSDGAVLVELGSCGNSLEEALYSAQLLASGLIEMLAAG